MRKALSVVGLLAAAGMTVLFMDCGGGAGAAGTPATVPTAVVQIAATPTFSPSPGTFTSAQLVTLGSATSSATIHYTTDGSTPSTSSTSFTAPISVSVTTTINAIATANGFNPSAMATGTYTIIPSGTPPPPPPPPGGGSPAVQPPYATYIGGNGADAPSAMTVDVAGNLYLVGTTSSSDFAVTAGAFRTTSLAGSNCGTAPQLFPCSAGFVLKLDPSGSKLLFSSFFPGVPTAVAVDGNGAVYVAGNLDANSPLPVTAGALNGSGKLFVAKLDSTGSTLLKAGTFGSSGLDVLTGLAVDGSGNMYVTGWSFATDFPVTAGAIQTVSTGAFVTKISADVSTMLYSARFGGSDSASRGGFGTRPQAITVDGTGVAYISGLTDSTDFPTTANAFQTTLKSMAAAFLTKLNAAGSALLYSSLLGGGVVGTVSGPGALTLAVDGKGSAYITGRTLTPSSFPLTAGVFQTGFIGSSIVFVAKFDPSLSGAQSLVFSTFLDGPDSSNGTALGFGLAADAAGNVYITGSTSGSKVFPTTPNATTTCNPATNGAVFISVLNSQGAGLYFGTLLGGSGNNHPVGLGLDSLGNLFVAGETSAYDFPVTVGALRTVNTGPHVVDPSIALEGFAVRINASTLITAALPAPRVEICSPLEGATVSVGVSIESVVQGGGVSPAQVSVAIDGAVVKTFANQSATSTIQPIGVGPHTITVSANPGGQTVSRTVTVTGQ